MTSIPLILPLKASEAAALAGLVYEQAEGRRLTDDLRHRLAARIPALELKTFTPFPGSLQQDPIHPSTYYVAVDTLSGGPAQPLLLRIALDSSPASGLFPGAMLIGRMRAGGREIVINAIPFAAADRSSISTFAEKVDRAFLPRPQGSQPTISVSDGNLETAFDDFRAILRAAGLNLASLECDYHSGVWAAIRAGWREGYSVGAGSNVAAEYTRFTIKASSRTLAAVEEFHDHITKLKMGQDSWKHFDLELSLAESETPTTPDELGFCLEWLKTRGRPPQLVEPKLGRDHSRLSELAEVARIFNAIVSVRSRGDEQEAELEEIGRATGGRFNYKVSGKSADLRWIASCLLGQSISS